MKLSIKQTFWCLLAATLLSTLPFLGLYDYYTKGEPRESIVSMTMLDEGNWILPTNNGVDIPYKPVLFHWTVAAVSLIQGHVSEAGSRIPSALAMTAMVMTLFTFYARRRDRDTALVAALICLLCLEIHRNGSNCRVDMLLSTLVWGAMYLFYRWWEKGMRGIPWGAVLMMSLATMTKGPVGSVLPCLVMGGFMLLRGEPFLRSFLRMAFLGVLSLVLPALWYYAAWLQGGQEFLDLVYEENVGRMTHTMAYEACVHPWWFTFLYVGYGPLPFSLVPLLALWSLKGLRLRFSGSLRQRWDRLRAWISGLDDCTLYSLAGAVLILAFFCIPSSKRSVYIMPMYPFICYFLARLMLRLADVGKKSIRVFTDILSILALILFPLWLLLVLLPLDYDTLHRFMGSGEATSVLGLSQARAWWQILLILLSTATAAAWWILRTKRRSPRTEVWFSLLITFAAYLSVDGAYKPAALNARSVKPVAEEIGRLIPPQRGTLYEYIEAGETALGDPVHYFELNFYLGNRIQNFKREEPREGFLVIGQKDFELRREDFESQGYRFLGPVYVSEKKIVGQILSIIPFRK